MYVVAKCLHFVMFYMNENKNANKLSRVRSTDWKSSLNSLIIIIVHLHRAHIHFLPDALYKIIPKTTIYLLYGCGVSSRNETITRKYNH